MILRETSQALLKETHDGRSSSIDPARLLHDQLESASPDLLRELLATFIQR